MTRSISQTVRGGALPGAFLLLAAMGCASDTPTQQDGIDPAGLQASAAGIPLDRGANDVILEWNIAAHDALVAHDEYADPLTATRVYAMVHLAQHDAINAIDPVWESYAFSGRDRAANAVAAAAAAAHGVLSELYPEQVAAFDERLAASVAEVPRGTLRRGLDLGQRAASAMLALRRHDGSETPVIGDYEPGTGPGRYQFTPPFTFAFSPGWRSVQPFGLESPDQFRSPPPPAISSGRYASDLNEVKAIGRVDSGTRTAEQTASAAFWYEFSDIGWNRIARVVSAERKLGLQSTARLFALLNIAIADAYIAGWDSKFHYDLWRPVTAIQAADADGNAATEADPEWASALVTPPVQDYPSTHSALGDAAASVLASVFGDDTRFTFTSTSALPGSAGQSFDSFTEAADANARSRVLGGLHFRFACDAGQALGRDIGAWTVSRHLRMR